MPIALSQSPFVTLFQEETHREMNEGLCKGNDYSFLKRARNILLSVPLSERPRNR